MIGMAIAGGSALAGQIIGGISAAKAYRRQRRALEAEKKKNQLWYERRYNEDATQTASAQRMLTRVEDSIRKRNQAAAGSAAVMGGGAEDVAQAKEANNAALADAASQIVANAEARKDAIEQQYLERDAQLAGQQQAIRAEEQAQMVQAIGQSLATAGQVAGAFAGGGVNDELNKKSNL